VELILPTVDADTGTVSEVWDKLGFRETVGRAAQQRVWLKDQDLPGAHLVIQQTEALTALTSTREERLLGWKAPWKPSRWR
jgi:Ribonuclease G/E